jgi:hypothetical protein
MINNKYDQMPIEIKILPAVRPERIVDSE